MTDTDTQFLARAATLRQARGDRADRGRYAETALFLLLAVCAAWAPLSVLSRTLLFAVLSENQTSNYLQWILRVAYPAAHAGTFTVVGFALAFAAVPLWLRSRRALMYREFARVHELAAESMAAGFTLPDALARAASFYPPHRPYTQAEGPTFMETMMGRSRRRNPRSAIPIPMRAAFLNVAGLVHNGVLLHEAIPIAGLSYPASALTVLAVGSVRGRYKETLRLSAEGFRKAARTVEVRAGSLPVAIALAGAVCTGLVLSGLAESIRAVTIR